VSRSPSPPKGAGSTAEETAAHFNVHPETIKRYYRRGVIPGYRFGPTLLRFDIDEVRKALAENR
jgi:excisionase family DNA binding protein